MPALDYKNTIMEEGVELISGTNSHTSFKVVAARSNSRENEIVIGNGLDLEKGFTPLNGGGPEVDAIKVTNAVKNYGSTRILKNLNMSVPQGTIYSLLGSSGCGKTTLLSCIVGVKNLDAGNILVFGAKTGTPESGLPGRRVGYMPQEIALYGDLTIKETIRYFGEINGMSRDEIIEEMGTLIDILDLPDPARLVRNLSGGQQRRLSLAVSLIHGPELVILDEPTVGVDPLLRESIWNYIRELVRVNQVTVIITTHYIDEARHSNRVGVMRDGKILAEKSPQALYEEHGTTFLEDIVLKLCHEDEKDGTSKKRILIKPKGSKASINKDGFKPLLKESNDDHVVKHKRRIKCGDFGTPCKRIKAMLTKNILLTLRRLLFTAFTILVPGLVLPLVLSVAGGTIGDVKVGVVNFEMNGNGTGHCHSFLKEKRNCGDMEGFSCKFLSLIPHDKFTMTEFRTRKEALEKVQDGTLSAFITFPHNFSESVFFKISADASVSENIVQSAVISVKMDETSPAIGPTIQGVLTETHAKFVNVLLKECELPAKFGIPPLKFENPVYGGEPNHLRTFGAIGFIVIFSYFFTMCSTSMNFVWDKKLKTMERAQVSGVQFWEILMASTINELILLLVQVGLSFTILFVGYNAEIAGSPVIAFTILLLVGITGNASGFMWGVFSREEVEAVILCIFAFFPGVFLGGIFYPIEAVPKYLMYITHFGVPTFFAGEAVKSVFHRGFGITHMDVWRGYTATGAWISVFWILTIMVHKWQKSKH